MTTAPRSNPTISKTENVGAATLAPGAAREEFLKVKEVAARLRVAPMTIYRAIEAGEFPGTILVRGSIRVPVSAYEAYLKSSVINP